jgi:hypothetical protein
VPLILLANLETTDERTSEDRIVNAPTKRPGPVARSAFRTGMVAAVVLGLAGVAALHWAGAADALVVAYLLVLVFPVYLVLAASALNVWLGYGKDVTDLRPVTRGGDS